MEMDLRMGFDPAVSLGFVGIEVVQDDMNLPVWMVGDDSVHEIQELAPATTLIVARLHLARHNIQGGKQRGSAVTFVAVAEPVHSLAIRQPQKALRAFQGLYMRLF